MMRKLFFSVILLCCLPLVLCCVILEQVAAYEQSLLGGSQTTAPSCAAPCKGNQAIAQAALSIADHLSGNPDVWYDRGMPAQVLEYWTSVCPAGSGCWMDWQEGNLQCVMLVTGTYALAGHALPVAGNAFDFWGLYQNRPGWLRLNAGAALAGQRQAPEPGDIMVWWDAPPAVGHVAIVTAVVLPKQGRAGTVTFAEANGPGALVTEPLLPDLSVVTWPGYVVYGYIRLQPSVPTMLYQSPKKGAR